MWASPYSSLFDQRQQGRESVELDSKIEVITSGNIFIEVHCPCNYEDTDCHYVLNTNSEMNEIDAKNSTIHIIGKILYTKFNSPKEVYVEIEDYYDSLSFETTNEVNVHVLSDFTYVQNGIQNISKQEDGYVLSYPVSSINITSNTTLNISKTTNSSTVNIKEGCSPEILYYGLSMKRNNITNNESIVLSNRDLDISGINSINISENIVDSTNPIGISKLPTESLMVDKFYLLYINGYFKLNDSSKNGQLQINIINNSPTCSFKASGNSSVELLSNVNLKIEESDARLGL